MLLRLHGVLVFNASHPGRALPLLIHLLDTREWNLWVAGPMRGRRRQSRFLLSRTVWGACLEEVPFEQVTYFKQLGNLPFVMIFPSK